MPAACCAAQFLKRDNLLGPLMGKVKLYLKDISDQSM